MLHEENPARSVILVYHRVIEPGQDFFRLGIAPNQFRAHLEILRRSYRPWELTRIAQAPSGAVAVTFDDGYANNLEVASDLLLEYQIPATFFVNSAALDASAERFWDALERMLFDPDSPRELRLADAGQGSDFVLDTPAARTHAFELVHSRLMHAPLDEREMLMHKLEAWYGRSAPPRPELRALTRSELRELAARKGHCVGSHGKNHLLLPAQTPEVIRAEIEHDKSRLEALLGQGVTCFSYPFGANDASCRRAAQDAGFALAVGCEPRAVDATSDRFALPRLDAAALDAEALARSLESLIS